MNGKTQVQDDYPQGSIFIISLKSVLFEQNYLLLKFTIIGYKTLSDATSKVF